MSDLPIQVILRGPQRQNLGDCTTWASVSVVARRNDLWQWTLVTSNPADAALMLPATNTAGKITSNRGVILRRIQPDGSAVTFMSGWQSKYPDVSTDGGLTTWTFTGYDDTKLLASATLWPKPDAAVTAQTDTHHRISGPASNRIRGYAIANLVTRLGVDGFSTGSQLNLGPSKPSQARFDDFLPFAQNIAGRALNFQVRQRDSDSDLFLYQWLPPDRRSSVRFSPALGTVTAWSSASTEPTVNVVIVGAGGEGVLRRFRRYVDQASINVYGPLEVFKDRRDLNPDEDPDWELQAEVDALEILEEGAARSTFQIDIQGADGARPFVDYVPGDRVLAYADADEAQQPIGPVVDDLVEEIQVTYSAEGEQGTVRVGSTPDDVDNVMARQIRELGRQVKGLETRR